MKRVLKLTSLILTFVILLVGCTDTSSQKEEKEEDNKTKAEIEYSQYINLTMIKPATINPILNTNKSVGYILDLVYDSLFEFDENYNIQPKLVENYDVASNNKSVDIKLKDVTWHNKDKLTSRDVKYSVDLIKSNKQSPYYNLISNISNVKVISNKKLTINFKTSYAFSLETLIFPIVSQDKLSGLSKKSMELPKKNLVGNGAYKIKDYEDRKYMILEPNKEYYDNEHNNDREIYIKMVPDNESQVALLSSLDSDISNVTLTDISKFIDNEHFNIEQYESKSYEYGIFNYENKYLSDLNIRKAIMFSLNKDVITKDAYAGRIKFTNFPLNSTSNYYDNDLKPLSYNTDNAENYLKKAVLSLDKTKNKDKVNNKEEDKKEDKKEDEKPITFKDVTRKQVNELVKDIKFTIIANKDNSERLKVANKISANLQSIGIKSEIKELTTSEMSDALKKEEYDIALIGCDLPGTSDATPVIEQLGYSDDVLNGYLNKLKKATTEDEIKKIYKEIQEYVRDKAIFMSFGVLYDYVVSNSRLEGKLDSNDFNIYRGICDLTVKK